MTGHLRTLPVPLERSRPTPARAPGPLTRPAAPFVAQLLGQGGVGRGLKGGPELPAEARAAYLRAEHAGEGDRRLPPGVFRNTGV